MQIIRRILKKFPNQGLWFPVLAVFFVWPLVQIETSVNAAAVPVDFCYRIQLTIANASGAALTNYGIRFPINASQLVSSQFLEDYAIDLRPVTDGLLPREVVVQDIDASPSNWWVFVPSIPNNQSVSISLYMGNTGAFRNQGFFFTGTDTATVADTADLRITDALELVVTASSPTPDIQSWFVEKLNGAEDTGYALGTSTTGSGSIIGQIDDQTLEVTWDGTEQVIRMAFDNPTLEIFFLNADGVTWDSQGTSNTGLGSVGTSTDALIMGDSFVGTNLETYILDGTTKVAQWGFHAKEGASTNVITETSAANPTYQGTILDDIASHDATYSLTRDQTGVTTTVSAVLATFVDPAITVSETFAEWFGDPTDSDLFEKQTASQAIPFLGILGTIQAATGMTADAFWFVIFGGLGVLTGIPAFILTKKYEVTATIIGFMFILGNIVGLIDPWVTVIYIMVSVVFWMVARFGRSS